MTTKDKEERKKLLALLREELQELHCPSCDGWLCEEETQRARVKIRSRKLLDKIWRILHPKPATPKKHPVFTDYPD